MGNWVEDPLSFGEENGVSVLIQEIPVVDWTSGEVEERQGVVSECSQGRGRAKHRDAEAGGRECRGEAREERYCWSQECRGE